MKKYKYLILIVVFLFVFTGCSASSTQAIDPNGGFWDAYFVWPLHQTILWFADIMQNPYVGSYGLSIIVVTIIIRLLILPLNIKQIKSSKAIAALQPEVTKIRDKYKDNPQKLQEEMMKLYQANNVNPLSGCLPILIQMPILIAFYHAISRSSEIAHSTFLGLSLGAADPTHVLPILAAILTYFQTKMMGNTGVNAQQQQLFLYIMPVMIMFIAWSLPSALSLYWVVGNIFSIAQTYYVKSTPYHTSTTGQAK